MRFLFSKLLNSIWYGGSRYWMPLWPLSMLYRAIYRVHRRIGLNRRLARPDDGVPVVVVGNITVGGTGKTPLVIWLARELLQAGYSVGILTRGYLGQVRTTPRIVGSDDDPEIYGDEAVLLARRTGCPVAVGADRNRAKRHLLNKHRVDVVLADDGLQHHRLNRCCEIAVIDGARGLGNRQCLPAGPLREPASRLRSVDVVVINGPGWDYPGALRAHVRAAAVERLGDGASRALREFAGRRVHAVAGIGNPERFFALLRDAGLDVIAHPLADHARISKSQLRFATSAPVLLTEKDAVKCRDSMPAEDVWAVAASLEFSARDRDRLLTTVVSRVETCLEIRR